jgi:hypothetical protein
VSLNVESIQVVEFSPVQRAWHIETLSDHAKKNLELLLLGRLGVTAFCAVALAENYEEAHSACEQIREFMEKHPHATEEARA